MGWILKKADAEDKVDVRLTLPGNLHGPYKKIADETGVELAEVIRQALAYSLKRYNAGQKKKAAAPAKAEEQGSALA